MNHIEGALLGAILAIGLIVGLMEIEARPRRTVETFTSDLTVTINCYRDCDLAAMIAEAREAVEK